MKNTLMVALLSLITLTACMQSKPTKTIANLKAGIVGETTASAKYAAFAQKAREDGDSTIAKLFDAASKSESIHAANHSKVLADLGEKMDPFTPQFEVKTTAENLQAAIDGETYEVTTMYPQFLADTKAESVNMAERSFNFALDTEQKHQKFYTKTLEALNATMQGNLATDFLICPVCGNTYEKESADEKCAFCMTGKAKFIAI